MRLFEMLLVVGSFMMLVLVCNKERIPRKVLFGVGIVTGLVLGITLLFEGFRWQMILIYMIAFIFLIIPKKSNNFVTNPSKLKNMLRGIVVFLTLILICISSALAYFIPVYKLPKPTGIYKVGTQTFNFLDESRAEIFTDEENDKRQLVVQMWYPAGSVKNKVHGTLFPRDKAIFKQYKKLYGEAWGIPGFVFDYWKYIKNNSFRGAEILANNGSFPLVIISHGMANGSVFHTSQAENLASHGYIVVAVDHTYSTTATAFSNGRVTGFETNISGKNFSDEGVKYENVWTEDINFIISQIERLNNGDNMFNEKINMNSIGVMGHSFGGATAFNSLYLNAKIDAGIDMDGSLCIVDNRMDIKKPFMFMLSENYYGTKNFEKNISDEELREHRLTRDEYNKLVERSEKEEKIMKSALKNGGTRIYIKGTEHMNFNDLQLISKIVKFTRQTGDIDELRSWNIVNKYILDFFNLHLKGKNSNLLTGPNKEYPEVVYK
jgi:dienelactone hydrolase